MKQLRSILLSMLLLSANSLLAQDGGGGLASNWYVYLILAVVVILFFMIVVSVSDNLLAIEAQRTGVQDKSGGGFSIFPSFNEIFPKKTPSYIEEDDKVISLKRGYDLLLEGEPERKVDESVKANTFGIEPTDFIGISPIPKLVVEVGQNVQAGDTVFFDKKRPEIKYAAPVSGEVIEINRGEKRSIVEVVILADKEQKYRSYSFDLENSTREELVNFLLDSGVWPMIRQRPYNIVAAYDEVPRDIFVSTFDTAPLAPDLGLVIEGKADAFQKGLDVLNRLTEGNVYLGLDGRGDEGPAAAFRDAQHVERVYFDGKHPIGNVGVQIHNIKPIGANDRVWTMGVQEVITLGKLFTEGKFDCERIVALTGAELKTPKYVRTHVGARISELLEDNLANDHVRFISGDALSGEQKQREAFLGFYDDQITVLEEGDYYEMFGWLLPIAPRPSISNTFPNFLFPDLRFKGDTNTHGEKRAFVVTGNYERVLPMDIYPQELMKSIIINDIEKMEGLGINELVEEDIAICEFVCVSKQPLQQILRQGLDKMREEG